jgi:tetratricopeptide (TPR) repeat protein
MKPIKYLIASVLFFLGVCVVQAQGYEFKVVASHGQVHKENSNSRLWAGSQLSSRDKVVVGSASYLGLVHKSGKTIEIKSPGTYSIAELSAKVSNGRSSTTSKYVNYVVGEMAKAEKQDINTNHRRYMAITGSVQRALLGKVAALLPEEVVLYEPKLYLELFATNPDTKYKGYKVEIKTLFDAEAEGGNALKTFVIEGDKGEIDLSFLQDAGLREKLGLYEDEPFMMVITPIEDNNEEANVNMGGASMYSLRLLAPGDGKYQEISQELGDEPAETAIDYILKAAYFEEKGLFADALRCYNKAIELAPEVEAFQAAKMDFVERHQKAIMRESAQK